MTSEISKSVDIYNKFINIKGYNVAKNNFLGG